MQCCLKKNQTTPRPSEHPPVMGEKILTFSVLVANPKKLLYTANPARGLLNREKRTSEKSLAAYHPPPPPPPTLLVFGENI